MTVLELMIVLAIIGGAMMLVRSGFRLITRADLVENASELSAVLRRASALAIEHGEMHRVVIDMDKQLYSVEINAWYRAVTLGPPAAMIVLGAIGLEKRRHAGPTRRHHRRPVDRERVGDPPGQRLRVPRQFHAEGEHHAASAPR